MMMSKRVLAITMAALCGVVLGCSDSGDDGTSGTGAAGTVAGQAGATGGTTMAGMTGGTTTAGTTAGTTMAGTTGGTIPTGGTGGGGAGMCVNTGEDNVSCPDGVGPFDGPCAPKGMCCHRSSNTTKIAALGADESALLEYRVTQSNVVNHPLSTGLGILLDAATGRAKTCAGEQCLLWRFEQPRMGGMPVAGAGKSTVSIGRYNCDGTYSYYDNTVAPDRTEFGFTAPTRWGSVSTDTTIDPAVQGVGRTKIAWASNPNKRLSCSPFFLPNTMDIDWELCSSGFEMLDFDTTTVGEDCQGEWDGTAWVTPGRYQVFVPLADNNKDVIDLIMQNFAQLLSFSVTTDKTLDPVTEPRCLPDDPQPMNPMDRTCKWVKLPDSLCPVDDAERALFRCHLGAEGNPNASQETDSAWPADLNCTAEAPTTALDPDVDAAVSKGQCCDPLGMNTNNLPACNAFRIVNKYAAAAAEILDEPSGEFPPICGATP